MGMAKETRTTREMDRIDKITNGKDKSQGSHEATRGGKGTTKGTGGELDGKYIKKDRGKFEMIRN